MQIQDIQTSVSESISYFNVVALNIGKLTFKIFDKNGFIAKTISAQITQGAQLFDVNMSDLSNGTYMINAFSDDKFLKAYKFTKE